MERYQIRLSPLRHADVVSYCVEVQADRPPSAYEALKLMVDAMEQFSLPAVQSASLFSLSGPYCYYVVYNLSCPMAWPQSPLWSQSSL